MRCVFTATSSLKPLIYAIPESKNTAIIALGSDDECQSQILPDLFKFADITIVDSKPQAEKFGDIAKVLKSELLLKDRLIELDTTLKAGTPKNAKTIIVDLSGIGAQDVSVAEFVLSRL